MILLVVSACVPDGPGQGSTSGLHDDGGTREAHGPGLPHCINDGPLGRQAIPRRVVVNHGRDHARYDLPPRGPLSIEMVVTGIMDLDVEGPSADYPDEVEATLNIVGHGRAVLGAGSDGTLTYATWRGRALDLSRPSTHYADGTPIDAPRAVTLASDFQERFDSLGQQLAASLRGCLGDPPEDPPSCPTNGQAAQVAGFDVGGASCAGCWGAALTELTHCLLGVAEGCAACAGAGLFAGLCEVICLVVGFLACIALYIFSIIECQNSEACCPERCDDNMDFINPTPQCCHRDSTCVDPTRGLCCDHSCGGGTCCPVGNTCASDPNLAGSLACDSATVCCPTANACGDGCCAEANMCADQLNGPCCEGTRGNPGGPCPGSPGDDSTPANCCNPDQSCADFGVCCKVGTQCERNGTCCPDDYTCNAPGAQCCPAGMHFCADCLPNGACFEGDCPTSETGEPVFCLERGGVEPVPSMPPADDG